MDRFAWTDGLLSSDESLILQQNGVRIYDGEEKTAFDYGKLVLTTHRLIWRDHKDQQCVLSMPLSYVVYAEEIAATFTKSPKITLHVAATPDYKPPGPVVSSQYNYTRLSFRDGGEKEFYTHLQETISKKMWDQKTTLPPQISSVGGRKARAAGIVGIERKRELQHKAVDKNISQAFTDLSKLMDMAKDMVNLSKNITTKIKEKQGDISEDETIRFKSYLMSLGIADPVTRDTHGTGDKYYRELSKQISQALEKPLMECGGLMTLTDVYCRINRARGMELLSPEDLIQACKLMSKLQLPVRMRVFESGVMVVQLQSHSEDRIVRNTASQVKENGCLTAEELSKLTGVSVVLSKERLLSTEKSGEICRDESVEGLKFYPNYFLNGPPETGVLQ